MKLGLFITARLKSSRLPFKALMDLNGLSVIERVISRAKEVQGIDRIVVCTSGNPQDYPIVAAALKQGVFYFQGSEEDVLQRLHDAAVFHRLDGFISVTADNPLFSIYGANRLVDFVHREGPDIAEVTDVPLGMGSYFLKTKAVEVGCRVKETHETEFWPVLLCRPELFKMADLSVGLGAEDSYRLTLDTQNDYKLISRIYREVPFKSIINEFDVLSYLEERPEVVAINSGYKRSWLDGEKVKRIDDYFEANVDRIRAVKEEVFGHDFS